MYHEYKSVYEYGSNAFELLCLMSSIYVYNPSHMINRLEAIAMFIIPYRTVQQLSFTLLK